MLLLYQVRGNSVSGVIRLRKLLRSSLAGGAWGGVGTPLKDVGGGSLGFLAAPGRFLMFCDASLSRSSWGKARYSSQLPALADGWASLELAKFSRARSLSIGFKAAHADIRSCTLAWSSGVNLGKFLTMAIHLRRCTSLNSGQLFLSGYKACCCPGSKSFHWEGAEIVGNTTLGVLVGALGAVGCAHAHGVHMHKPSWTSHRIGSGADGCLSLRFMQWICLVAPLFSAFDLEELCKARVNVGIWRQFVRQQFGVDIGQFMGALLVADG